EALRVGVLLLRQRDEPLRHLGMDLHHQRQLHDDRVAGLRQALAVHRRHLGDREAITVELHDLGALIGAAVVILDAVDRLGLTGARVLGVLDAVPVVVELGAAVLVLEVILVLGADRALVVRVEDAVGIVVGLGAAIAVLEAVLVLFLHRAGVDRVGDVVGV